MKSVASLVSKLQLKTFSVSCSPEYKTLALQHVIADKLHPLRETQRRKLAARKEEGLWWHTSTGVALSRSSCVRAWARRRLQDAVKAELHERGYDETGRLVNVRAIQARPDLLALLHQGKSLNFIGSLRLFIQPPLIPASFAQVRGEAGKLIESMLQALKNEAGGRASTRKLYDRASTKPAFAAIPKARPKNMRPNQQQRPSR